MVQTPYELIKKTTSTFLPSELLSLLPNKWEKIGSVVTMKLPKELYGYKVMVGKVYAEVLEVTSVLNDLGGISGVYREPVVEVMYGSPQTETIHVENGIRFMIDPQRIMFSSGNMGERRRMASVASPDDIVVDLFAGIGYFSLPIAVYSKPKKVFACEINPIAYEYLCRNVVLNRVGHLVEPCFGDNRLVAPKGCASRVILGYLHDPWEFLPVALQCLKNMVGVLHYHELVPVKDIPRQPLSHIECVATEYDRQVELITVEKIKSYAPRIHHVVLDVRITQ